MQRCLVGLTLVLAVTSSVLAHGDGRDHLSLIEEALALAGVREALRELGPDASARAQAQGSHLPPNVQEALDRSIARHTRPEALHALMVEAFQRDFDYARMEAALAWLRSPLSRRMVSLEVSANTPAAQGELQRFAGSLGAQPPGGERLSLVQRLDRASRGTETALAIVSAMTRGLAGAVAPTLPTSRRPKPGELERIDREIRVQYGAPIEEALTVRMLFAYREVGEDELAEYVRYWESEGGRQMAAAIGRAFVHTLGRTMERVGRDLARAMPPDRAAPAPRRVVRSLLVPLCGPPEEPDS